MSFSNPLFSKSITINRVLHRFFILIFLTSQINAQQQYSKNSIFSCNSSDETRPSPAFLYTCNGQDPSCKAFLIFKSQPPYSSVPTISALMSSNLEELARINNVTTLTVFPTNKEVIVPASCSCLGQYYQANTTINVPSIDGTYHAIANNTCQGLSTCDSLKRANPIDEFKLQPGVELQVPLRCACPTKNQTVSGTKYLLTYLVSWYDNIHGISERFNVSETSILAENGFLEENPTLFPFTTILIPLPSNPSSSQTIIQYQQPDIPPPSSSNSRNSRSKRKLYLCVGIAVGSLTLVLGIILSLVFLFYKRTKGVSQVGRRGQTDLVFPEDLRVEIASYEQGLKVFEFEEIKKATENFSSKNRIKGCVYRDVFGEILAVKKMNTDVSKEVTMLKKVNHSNLIELMGVSENNGSFYLVFEYMQTGSLREWLRNKSTEETQNGAQRIQIAIDVANGLHYLHSFTEPAYVHKDIKSTNVLLNSNLRAKIANFSLARTAVRKIGAAQTTHVVGTRGYMAPEYIEARLVTPMIDVYAFGVVKLELITGKDDLIKQDGREVLLSAAIVSIMERENAEADLGFFVNPSLQGNNGTDFALRVAKLSVACLTQEPARRLSMGVVLANIGCMFNERLQGYPQIFVGSVSCCQIHITETAEPDIQHFST